MSNPTHKESLQVQEGHTQGPWDALEGRTLIHIETPLGHPTPGIAICSLPKKHKANTRLIAAAPELLEALEDALVVISECDPETVREHCPKIRAAIAKAKGGAE